jgi:hypothetical protein
MVAVIGLLKKHVIWGVVLGSLLLFFPGLFNYFGGDDWFHLRVAQISTITEFLNFFNPINNPQSTAFYRPIPNQLYFFVLQSLFGLQPLFYHVPVFLMFGASIWLVYRLILKLGFSRSHAILAATFFGFSSTHFTQLYFISANQEIFMVFFVLWYLWFALKETARDRAYALVFLGLALLSKDTAVVAPLLYLCIRHGLVEPLQLKKLLEKAWWQKQTYFIPVILICVAYLVIRFFIFDTHALADSTYTFDFSPKRTLHSLYFYTHWTLGAPEFIQDYLQSFWQFLPKFYEEFQSQAYILLGTGALWFGTLGLGAGLSWKKYLARPFWQLLFLGGAFFVLGLGPVLFLPDHKFTIQLGVPMIGMALILSAIVSRFPKWLIIATVVFYCSYNLVSTELTQRTNYSVQRAKISQAVKEFFDSQYAENPGSATFYVNNARTVGAEIPTWGSSRQVAYALWHENFVQVYYKSQRVDMYYEDLNPEGPPKRLYPNDRFIELSADLFLQ